MSAARSIQRVSSGARKEEGQAYHRPAACTELRARYDLLKEGKSSKASDITFLASGSKRRNSRRRREKSPQLLPCSFRETSEEKNIGTTRQTFAKYNRS